jgi:hypothetical protein
MPPDGHQIKTVSEKPTEARTDHWMELEVKAVKLYEQQKCHRCARLESQIKRERTNLQSLLTVVIEKIKDKRLQHKMPCNTECANIVINYPPPAHLRKRPVTIK